MQRGVLRALPHHSTDMLSKVCIACDGWGLCVLAELYFLSNRRDDSFNTPVNHNSVMTLTS